MIVPICQNARFLGAFPFFDMHFDIVKVIYMCKRETETETEIEIETETETERQNEREREREKTERERERNKKIFF